MTAHFVYVTRERPAAFAALSVVRKRNKVKSGTRRVPVRDHN